MRPGNCIHRENDRQRRVLVQGSHNRHSRDRSPLHNRHCYESRRATPHPSFPRRACPRVGGGGNPSPPLDSGPNAGGSSTHFHTLMWPAQGHGVSRERSPLHNRHCYESRRATSHPSFPRRACPRVGGGGNPSPPLDSGPNAGGSSTHFHTLMWPAQGHGVSRERSPLHNRHCYESRRATSHPSFPRRACPRVGGGGNPSPPLDSGPNAGGSSTHFHTLMWPAQGHGVSRERSPLHNRHSREGGNPSPAARTPLPHDLGCTVRRPHSVRSPLCAS